MQCVGWRWQSKVSRVPASLNSKKKARECVKKWIYRRYWCHCHRHRRFLLLKVYLPAKGGKAPRIERGVHAACRCHGDTDFHSHRRDLFLPVRSSSSILQQQQHLLFILYSNLWAFRRRCIERRYCTPSRRPPTDGKRQNRPIPLLVALASPCSLFRMGFMTKRRRNPVGSDDDVRPPWCAFPICLSKRRLHPTPTTSPYNIRRHWILVALLRYDNWRYSIWV